MTEIVHDSILVKASVVGRDEREAGERKILNFGHTLAHALEKVEMISHGEAVALGMIFALKLSLRKGILKEALVLDRLIRLLRLYDLPVDLARDPEPVFQAMIKDKKKSGEAIDFILLEDIGKPRMDMIPLSVLREDVHDLCQLART